MFHTDFFRFFLPVGLIFCLQPNVGFSRCVTIDGLPLPAELEQTQEIVFFASWCLQCKEHLREARPKKTALVASFDEKGRAEKVLEALNISHKIPCFWDRFGAVTDAFEIKSLPARHLRE